MKISDWVREGCEPPFATIEDWLRDQLGQALLEEEATYALALRPETDRRGYAVRILIATDTCLADFTWERPAAVERRGLTAAYYAWHEVRGLRLTGTTHLEPATLMHQSPAWGLRLEVPELSVEKAEVPEAMLEFWHTCMTHVGEAGR